MPDGIRPPSRRRVIRTLSVAVAVVLAAGLAYGAATVGPGSAKHAADALAGHGGPGSSDGSGAVAVDPVAVQRAAGPLLDVVRELSDHFGGAWFERDGAIVVSALPSATDDERRRITAAAPAGALVRFVPATWSAGRLRAWADQLGADWRTFTGARRAGLVAPRGNVFSDLDDLGVEVSTLGVQDDTNRVAVGLVSLPDDLVDAVHGLWRHAAATGHAPPPEAVSLTVVGVATPS